MTTPIRSAIAKESRLVARIRAGLQAMKQQDVDLVEKAIRLLFADSLDLDDALREEHEQENRWDYLLGHTESGVVIGLEPHSAKSDQISTVIAKRKAAIDQLRGHLRPGSRVANWYWVASGNVDFADTEKARIRLDQNGIKFVGRKLLKKHLPGSGG